MIPRPADYEHLGAFYLGRALDAETSAPDGPPLLYDSRDLTTHAVCVGMTGSGKTGLCVSLLEEAAIDGVPAICIDPKGDLGNLLLTFPSLAASDFEPWIDTGDAARRGQSVAERAVDVAKQWREGLAQWGQDGARIARLREAADLAIYTPGSSAGRPLAVIRSLDAPKRADAETLREAVDAAVGSLLALIGVEADPLQSREHVFLANVLHHAWSSGHSLELGGLIRAVLEPPFARVGVLDLEAFFPSKDRQALAMRLNAILGNPGFSVWLEGEPLDVQRLLYTAEGKPRVSILSIAHLSDGERMFFVTRLLGELLGWMRAQPGTSSLRALLYMDEVAGFLPPVREPSSKRLFLTLLKQARAFGLGLVLATQNPIDVDYKALSNCGTWFLGRLQTERDVARVLDGLTGAMQSAGRELDPAATRALLAGLPPRTFLMNNVHEGAPILFHTRWALSYLRGPLTREQIAALVPRPAPASGSGVDPTTGSSAAVVLAGGGPIAAMLGGLSGAGHVTSPAVRDPATHRGADSPAAASHEVTRPAAVISSSGAAPDTAPNPPGGAGTLPDPSARPILSAEIEELFLGEPVGDFAYHPGLLASAQLHYVHARAGLDVWSEQTLLAPLVEATPDAIWAGAHLVDPRQLVLRDAPLGARSWLEIPRGALTKASLRGLESALKAHLFQSTPYTIGHCKETKLYSRPGEGYDELVARVRQDARESRDRDVAKLRERWTQRLERARAEVRKTEERVAREKGQARSAQLDAALGVGTTVLGAVFGGGTARGHASRAATAARKAGRVSQRGSSLARAEAQLEEAREKLDALEAEMDHELEAQRAADIVPAIESIPVPPRKGDLRVTRFAFAWVPVAP